MAKMKKLKIWHAFSILALMVGLSVSCNKDEEDIVLDFTITVPENWNYMAWANQGLVYSAQRTENNQLDSLREYLLIYKEKLTGYSLDAYYQAIKVQLLASEQYVSTIEEKDTTINGTSSKKIIYNELGQFITRYRDTVDLNQITTMYFFYEKSNGYNLSFVCIDTLYDDIKPVFDGIISTFQFKE
jgi:hypothetical protein